MVYTHAMTHANDIPKSNVKARRNVMGPGHSVERLFNGLNKWEMEQRISTGLPAPNQSGKYSALLEDPWNRIFPDFPRPDWERLIQEAYFCNSRDGLWLLARRLPPIDDIDPPRPPTERDPQQMVISAPTGACQLVDAPPGTGKTYCLLKRLRHLVDQHLTRNLRGEALVLTFSRTAKAELKARAASEFPGNDHNQRPEFRTIDSLTVELLQVACNESEANHDKRKRRLLSVLANQGKPCENASARLARYKWIFIDEFQDIIGLNGRTLLRIIELATEGRKRHGADEEGKKPPGLLVLGDHRQYINFFQLERITDEEDRNLVPEKFIEMLRKLLASHDAKLETIKLDKIYRAGDSGLLPKLMGQVRSTLDRALRPASDLKECWRQLVGDIKGTYQFAYDRSGFLNTIMNGMPHEGAVSGRFGILTRSNASARKLASVCMADPEVGPKVNLVQSPEGLGFPGWLGMLLNGCGGGNLADHGVFNAAYGMVPGARKPSPEDAREYISEAAGALGLAMHQQIDAKSFLVALENSDEPSELRLVSDPQGFWISTVHQSKGRQFPDVFLDESGLLPDALQGQDRDRQLESIRITYVAATRAMSGIHRIGDNAFSGMVDWDLETLPTGGIGDIECWKNWYYSLGDDGWKDARETIWMAYQNGLSLRIRHANGQWHLLIGNRLQIPLNEQYNALLITKAGNQGNAAIFDCQILDVRSRASEGKVFLMPILSGDLRRI